MRKRGGISQLKVYAWIAVVSVFFVQASELIGARTKEEWLANHPFLDSIVHKTGTSFDSIYYKELRVYYEPQSAVANDLDHYVNFAQRALDSCLVLIGGDTLEQPIALVYVSERDKMNKLFGVNPKGLALPEYHCAILVANDSIDPYTKHEIMHVVSINKWGRAAAPGEWMQEGLATYADGTCLGYSVHEIAADLYYKGRLLSLDSLALNFNALPDLPAYLQAASMNQYLIVRYGLKVYTRLWKSGIGDFRKIFKRSAKSFDKSYINFLKKKYPTPPNIDWNAINNRGCK